MRPIYRIIVALAAAVSLVPFVAASGQAEEAGQPSFLPAAVAPDQTSGFTVSSMAPISVVPDPSPDSAAGQEPRTATPYRAFSPSSYWNTPLAVNAPVDPNSAKIIAFLKQDDTTNYVNLSGTTSAGEWAAPYYWGQPTDPTYAIRDNCTLSQPPEFSAVQIPAGAKPDASSDGEMVVFNVARDLVFGMWQASYNSGTKTWSACGGAVYYLDSNGLDRRLPESDDPRNRGHRGIPPAIFAVRYSEVMAGSIHHVLKIAVNTTKCEHVFPMVGDECGTTAAYAPPEGTRIRIKPSVDLNGFGLSAPELAVARALQTYGAVIGDQSGGPVSLKVENTIQEGRGWLWQGVLTAGALSAIPLDDYEVISLGYGA